MSKNIEKLQIYSVLHQIEQLLSSSPRAKLTVGNKRVVDVDLMNDLLGDLKVTIPDDVRRSNSVLFEADTIIAEADERAQSTVQSAERRASMIIDKANARAEQVIDEASAVFEQKIAEHAVYQEAQKRAQALLQKAEHSASAMFDEVKRDSDALLCELQSYLSGYQAQIESNRKKLNVNPRRTRVETVEYDADEDESEVFTKPQSPFDDDDDYPQDQGTFSQRVKSAFSNLFTAESEEEDEFFEEEEADT